MWMLTCMLGRSCHIRSRDLIGLSIYRFRYRLSGRTTLRTKLEQSCSGRSGGRHGRLITRSVQLCPARRSGSGARSHAILLRAILLTDGVAAHRGFVEYRKELAYYSRGVQAAEAHDGDNTTDCCSSKCYIRQCRFFGTGESPWRNNISGGCGTSRFLGRSRRNIGSGCGTSTSGFC